MTAVGLKARAKMFLKEKGINRVLVSGRKVKLENARTVDVVNLALENGFANR